MSAIAIALPDWWNFKPLCQEIKVKCFQGHWVDIDFTEYLIQGANPTSERVRMGLNQYLTPQQHDTVKLVRDGSQRGFLNTIKPTSDPVHGVFYRNMEYGKIRYIPHVRFTGVDCFRFVLCTPWQSSNEYRVMINVVPAPSIHIYVNRYINDKNAFQYAAKLLGVPVPVKTHYFVWYELVPTLTMVNSRPEVVSVPRTLHTGNVSIVNDKLVVDDTGYKTQWVYRYWPDPDTDKKGYVPGTSEVYRYPAGPPPVLVRCQKLNILVVEIDKSLIFIFE